MTQSTALIEALKLELKARGITYAQVAERLEMSEASIKRMFSTRNFTLSRLDDICQFAEIDFVDLVRHIQQQETMLTELTLQQEQALVADTKLMLMAICAIHHLTYEQILAAYQLPAAEVVGLLVQLDRLQLIRLLPNNRIKPLVAKGFRWRADGPIQQYFFGQVAADFFRSRFDGPGETILFASGRLSAQSMAHLAGELSKITHQFRECHHEDLALPMESRAVTGMVVALRQWEFEAFRALRKK